MGSRPRDVLRQSLVALMRDGARRYTIPEVVALSGVSKGVVERMTKAQANTGVDHLEGVSKVFGLEPWQLLRPTLVDSSGPPRIAPSVALDALIAAITALSQPEREALSRDMESLTRAPKDPDTRARVLAALTREPAPAQLPAIVQGVLDSDTKVESPRLPKAKA